jgi:hypothetical protein
MTTDPQRVWFRLPTPARPLALAAGAGAGWLRNSWRPQRTTYMQRRTGQTRVEKPRRSLWAMVKSDASVPTPAAVSLQP